MPVANNYYNHNRVHYLLPVGPFPPHGVGMAQFLLAMGPIAAPQPGMNVALGDGRVLAEPWNHHQYPIPPTQPEQRRHGARQPRQNIPEGNYQVRILHFRVELQDAWYSQWCSSCLWDPCASAWQQAPQETRLYGDCKPGVWRSHSLSSWLILTVSTVEKGRGTREGSAEDHWDRDLSGWIEAKLSIKVKTDSAMFDVILGMKESTWRSGTLGTANCGWTDATYKLGHLYFLSYYQHDGQADSEVCKWIFIFLRV